MRSFYLFMVRSYQRLLSPMLPPACRFFPSCSHYSHEAVFKYGIVKGLWLTVKRIVRCNPWNAGGYDPVP